MKRLAPIILSDSDDSDENDLSKIKNKYKNPKKTLKKESINKGFKVTENQMNIMEAFSKVNTTKRKSELTMDTFFKKVPKIEKVKMSAEEFFSTSIIKKDVTIASENECHIPLSFVTEKSPQKIKPGKSESEIVNAKAVCFDSAKSGTGKKLFSKFLKTDKIETVDNKSQLEEIKLKTEVIEKDQFSKFLQTDTIQTVNNKSQLEEVKLKPHIIVKNIDTSQISINKEFVNAHILKTESNETINQFSLKPTTVKLSANPIIIPISEKVQQLPSLLFVDKYCPKTLNKIVGQHAESSPANKLLNWLRNFQKNLKVDSKTESEGMRFRAALLSGPPGIGKSTTAALVCKELGYEIVELNASCDRSKNALETVVSESCGSRLLFWKKDTNSKRCIIMEEVDGMAGNEDRGGINQLIQIIKTTRYPIICLCNDRQSRKLQSLVKYVYDLRFPQLTHDQVKATMLSVAFKEKIKLPTEAVNHIIKACNNDIRQVLNQLQMFSVGSLDNEVLKNDAKNGQKEFKLGPFDVLSEVFAHHRVKTVSDKSDLFFQDYQLGPLFVQENYPLVIPHSAKRDIRRTMKLMSLAADSIAFGDIINTKIQKSNNWDLLPTHAMFSSFIPGEYLHGTLSSRIKFPGFLGKLSKTNKNSQILSSLCSHLCLSTKGGVFQPRTISMEYGELLVRRLVTSLREGDIETVLATLNSWHLLKEDMDLLVEVTTWPHLAPPLHGVPPQIKALLTRAYNKSHFKMPYGIVSGKLKSVVNDAVFNLDSVLENGDDDDEEENKENGNDDEADGSESDMKTVVKSKNSVNNKVTENKIVNKRKPAAKKTKDETKGVLKEKKVTAKKKSQKTI